MHHLNVGDPAPAFSALDQNDNPHTLEGLSLINIYEPTRHHDKYRIPSYA